MAPVPVPVPKTEVPFCPQISIKRKQNRFVPDLPCRKGSCDHTETEADAIERKAKKQGMAQPD